MGEEEGAEGAGDADLMAELNMDDYDDEEGGGARLAAPCIGVCRRLPRCADARAPAERMYGAGMRGEMYHENEGDPYISVPEQDVDRDSEEDEDFTLKETDALLLVRAGRYPRLPLRLSPPVPAGDQDGGGFLRAGGAHFRGGHGQLLRCVARPRCIGASRRINGPSGRSVARAPPFRLLSRCLASPPLRPAVHHDVSLPAFPLCVEWMNTRPNRATGSEGSVGNFAAVGTFKPGIEIWNLDVVDAVEPVGQLGGVMAQEVDRKKGRKRTRYVKGSHRGAVMGLSWNRKQRCARRRHAPQCSLFCSDAVVQERAGVGLCGRDGQAVGPALLQVREHAEPPQGEGAGCGMAPHGGGGAGDGLV